MIVGAVLLSAALAAAPHTAPSDRERNDAIFEVGRARYFHALVVARKCEAALPDQTRLLTVRYDKALATLAEIYGQGIAASSPLAVPDQPNQQPMCDATLAGFAEKLGQIEQRASRGQQ